MNDNIRVKFLIENWKLSNLCGSDGTDDFTTMCSHDLAVGGEESRKLVKSTIFRKSTSENIWPVIIIIYFEARAELVCPMIWTRTSHASGSELIDLATEKLV